MGRLVVTQKVSRVLERLGAGLRQLCCWLGRVADPVSKWTTTLAVLVAGCWAYYQFVLAGSRDWVINMSLSTEVLPYQGNLDLLVIHVHLKNPTSKEFDFDASNSSYSVEVRNVPKGLKSGDTAGPDQIDKFSGGLVGRVMNMLPRDGYTMLPSAEFDDIVTMIVQKGSIVSIKADLEQQNGTLTKSGKPDYDYVSASKIMVVEAPEKPITAK